jgi:hypothetical protein
MANPRDRRPVDFQASRDENDPYLEKLERTKEAYPFRFARPSVVISLRVVISLILIVVAIGAFRILIARRSIDTEVEWGPNGSPRPDDTVWIAKCPNNREPITGTCLALRPNNSTMGAPLNYFGVNSEAKQWECGWSQRVVAANVRALCPR